jgi:centromere/kinetochore protein ZW10
MVQSAASADEADACVDAAVGRVRAVAAVWEDILARSTWAQAVGSLADALAKKVVADVLDMASIGQEDAYRIARLIARVTELDDVFVPSRLEGGRGARPPHGDDHNGAAAEEEIPQTAKYAPSWLRLKYLSELLQANLMDVRYLWFESELSLWFSVDEVVDLIAASFEANERARGVAREIQARPSPLAPAAA